MIDNGYLTSIQQLDAPVAFYDFEQLRQGTNSSSLLSGSLSDERLFDDNNFNANNVDQYLASKQRASAQIIEQIVELAQDRQGVMIFAATVAHARELISYLPPDQSALIIGDMKASARDSVIRAFKQRQIKFLVNVSVLTTGFDAPHVDVIAILRPTESVALFQQIVGRGLRLSEGKTDCLVLITVAAVLTCLAQKLTLPSTANDNEIVEVPLPGVPAPQSLLGQDG